MLPREQSGEQGQVQNLATEKAETPTPSKPTYRPHPIANVLYAEKQKIDTGISSIAQMTYQPPKPEIPIVLVEAKERVDTRISSLAQQTIIRPQPPSEPFLINRQGIIVGANPSYIPSGKMKDVVTGRPISQYVIQPKAEESKFMGTNVWQATIQGVGETFNPIQNKQIADPLAEQRYETWKRLPFNVKQQIIQGSSGTFENPFGLQTWRYYLTGDEKGAFINIYDPYIQKVGEKFKSPVSATLFLATETIPGAYYGFKGMSKGLGYVKGLGPTGANISHGANRIIGAYFTSETIKGASEASKQGPDAISKYILSTGAMLGVGAFGMKGFKEGETLGTRKRFISNLESPEQIARAKTIFEGIDRSTNISSRNIKPLDLNAVENLRGNAFQQQALRNALKSGEIKRYKTVLGGSAAGFEKSPHDIDIYVKKSITGKSNVKPVENIFKKYSVDLSLYDIHDLPKPGESFPQVGTGFALKPIRTAPGSDFKFQVSLSEQAGRKLASAWAPLHELRGKDWNTVMKISEERFTSRFTEQLGKYKPKIEGDKFVGPSYFEMNPHEAPRVNKTWLERQISKHGKPLTSQDLFTQEAWKGFAKPEAEPYRPKFVEKPNKIITDARAKGTIFWSSGIPLSEGGSKYRFPIVIPISYTGYSKTPEKSYPKYAPSISPKYVPNILHRYAPSPIEYPVSPIVNHPKHYPTTPYPKYPKMTYPVYPKSPEKYYDKSPSQKDYITPSKPGRPYPFSEDIFTEGKIKRHKIKQYGTILDVKELNIPTMKDIFGGR